MTTTVPLDLENACFEALEYFEDRQDVDDGDYGEPQANKEMQLASRLKEAMRAAGIEVDS